VATVMEGERIDVLSLPEDAQVVYELVEWTVDQRAHLGELLAESDIPHAWEDTDVIVAEVDEALVDELCAIVEGGPDALSAEPGDEVDDYDDVEGIDDESDIDEGDDDGGEDIPEGEVAEISYELDEWEQEHRDALIARLAESSIASTWEGTTLVVGPEDEDAVDALIEEIAPTPEELPEADQEVLGDLFVAADQLHRSAADEDGLRRLTAVIDLVDGSSAPFGMDAKVWDTIVDGADELADLLADGADDELIEESASQLRGLLRPFV
jgi:hypothetical protein